MNEAEVRSDIYSKWSWTALQCSHQDFAIGGYIMNNFAD